MMKLTPDAVRNAYRVHDRVSARERAFKPETACQKLGCSACCAFPVGVLDVEVPVIIEAIEALSSDEQNAVRNAVVRWTMDAIERDLLVPWPGITSKKVGEYERAYCAGLGLPCPLLDAGRCRIYESRPLACRALWRWRDEPCKEGDPGSEDADLGDVRQAAAMRLKGERTTLTVKLLAHVLIEHFGGARANEVVERSPMRASVARRFIRIVEEGMRRGERERIAKGAFK